MTELQPDISVVILPAVKGRSTVILNHENCLEKFMAHINNVPHQLHNKDLTKSKANTIKQLKDLKDIDDKLLSETY